jgi:hypothetical protein
MSTDRKNAFNDKTVVQSDQPLSAEEAAASLGGKSPVGDAAAAPGATPAGGEKTVVYAQSNLKETFDARTVVRSSKPTPPPSPLDDVVPPAPVELTAPPPAASAAEEPTDPGIRLESVTRNEKQKPEGKLSASERRAARAALDRKTRVMVAAFAALCALIILCLVVAFGAPKGEKPTETASVSSDETPSELASVAPPAPPPEKPQAIGSYENTTQVLMKFDRAAQRAQEHALDYSK